MQLVIHAPFGARINRAWGLALRKRFCRSFNFELQAAATDNGIKISLGEQHSFPLEAVFEFLRPETVEDVLTQALLDAPMFTARWRWNASRALAIPRFSGGRKVPPPIQRMRADDLMAAVFPDHAACPENLAGEIRIPDHPLVKETIANCLYEAMDLNGVRALLAGMRAGQIQTVAIDTAEPSPFSHEILNANPYAYLDDAPLEERRARAVQMRRTLPTDFAEGAGALDPEAIALVAAEAWPVVRDADELHEALLGLGVLPAAEGDAAVLFAELAANRRAATLTVDGRAFWIAAERLDLVRSRLCGRRDLSADRRAAGHASRYPIRPNGARRKSCADGSNAPVRGAPRSWRAISPCRSTWWIRAWRNSKPKARFCAARFTRRDPGAEMEWCHRRLLARIHRLTIGRLRREIEPVATAEFFAFLHRWQHLSPGTQLHGVDGTLQIVKQLQGCEFGAAAWESEVLPRRVAKYSPEYLDQLCLSGEVSWGRLSPHPAFEREEEDRDGERKARRVRPTRVAPLAIFLRDDAGWLLSDAAAFAQGFALAPRAGAAGGARNPRRELLRGSGARHRALGQRSGRRLMGVGSGGAGDRRWFRKPARAARS